MGLREWWRARRPGGLDEDDFDAEVRAHLAMAARDRVADGADPDDARHAAVKDFGNLALTRDAARRVWTPRWLAVAGEAARDARFAGRALRKHPGFALTVIGVFALGIGLNAAVFTMLKGMALNPLAGVDRASSLVVGVVESPTGRQSRLSYPDYREIRDHARTLDHVFGSSLATLGVGRGTAGRTLWAELVTGNYFEALGVRASRGRTLLPSDETASGGPPVAVISDTFWRRQFDGAPDVVGRSVEVNHRVLTVVGVADPMFHGTIVGYDVEIYAPITMAGPLGVTGGGNPADPLADPAAHLVFPHARLASGATLAAASAEATAIWRAQAGERPITEAQMDVRIVPFWRSPTGAQTFMLPTLVVVAVMGALVLAIACANIAGLVLVRALTRRGEIAVRLALGASRGRIVRLLLVESVLLAVPGAALGTLAAVVAIPRLITLAEAMAAPQKLFFNAGIDAWVIAFAIGTAAGAALLSGFMPAWQTARIDLVDAMRESSLRGAARGRFRTGLVVAQVAVSLLLLVSAGLLSRSAAAARRADPGFQPAQVTALELDLKQNAYDETAGRRFYRTLVDAMRTTPGVDLVSLAAFQPLALIDTPAQAVSIDGYVPRADEDTGMLFNAVTADYFETLRIPIRRGRAFTDHDDGAGAPVAIVNETLARRYWSGPAAAIGRRLQVADGTWRTIVGVAADVKYLRINETPRPYVYLPFLQAYRARMILHVRGTAPEGTLVAAAAARIAEIDPDLALTYAKPLSERIGGSFVFFDLGAEMLFLFGSAGMALVALGTYGLVSYTVRQSTHEIGIRMALGAGRADVVREFLGRGLRLGAIGSAVGLALALTGLRLLDGALFGVSATDAVSFARALALVAGAVFVATLLPAWRAARTNPLRALRQP